MSDRSARADRIERVGPARIRSVRVQAQTRLRTVTCYCSVYDECWTADSDAVEPTPASECQTETSAEFGQ